MVGKYFSSTKKKKKTAGRFLSKWKDRFFFCKNRLDRPESNGGVTGENCPFIFTKIVHPFFVQPILQKFSSWKSARAQPIKINDKLIFFESRDRKRQGALYIQVEPKIRIGFQKTAQDLPLDSIRCQTVMAKCLGPLSTWESKLLVAKNSGYNLLHFTPIQVCLDERS